MIGIHDLGGLRGFGPVAAEADEPVFHEPWQARAFAVNILGGRWTAPEFRASIERMPPVEYLATSYYEHWLHQMEEFFLASGLITAEELAQGRSAGPPPAGQPPAIPPERVVPMLRKGDSCRAPIATPPRFAPGQRVVVTLDNPPTHSRVPAYVRGRTGTVTAGHGGFWFADAQAQGILDRSDHLYTVRFAAVDLWGRNGGANDAVYVDLHESYLEAAS
ncbi:MAG: nitrile hydratase subunit beta [Dongiaceae bacterium]